MDKEYSIYGLIQDIIIRETRFLKHYIGEVKNNIDPLAMGRILVTIDELGWSTPDIGAWCYPRDKNSLTTPAIGDWVEVYFIDGDVDRPVYLGVANEIAEMTPKTFDGMPTTHVLFEDPVADANNIKFDGVTGELSFLSGTESMVLGDTLKTELQKNVDALIQLQTDFNGWTPVPNDGGAALKTILSSGFLTKVIGSLVNILSIVMKVK